MGASQNYGYLFGDPQKKGFQDFGVYIGSPYFGKLPYLRICHANAGLHFPGAVEGAN